VKRRWPGGVCRGARNAQNIGNNCWRWAPSRSANHDLPIRPVPSHSHGARHDWENSEPYGIRANGLSRATAEAKPNGRNLSQRFLDGNRTPRLVRSEAGAFSKNALGPVEIKTIPSGERGRCAGPNEQSLGRAEQAHWSRARGSFGQAGNRGQETGGRSREQGQRSAHPMPRRSRQPPSPGKCSAARI